MFLLGSLFGSVLMAVGAVVIWRGTILEDIRWWAENPERWASYRQFYAPTMSEPGTCEAGPGSGHHLI